MVEHECPYATKIDTHSIKIEALETKSNYKEEIITEMKTDIKEIKEALNDYVLKSIDDDSNIKEILNRQDQRITQLETTDRNNRHYIRLLLTLVTISIALNILKLKA